MGKRKEGENIRRINRINKKCRRIGRGLTAGILVLAAGVMLSCAPLREEAQSSVPEPTQPVPPAGQVKEEPGVWQDWSDAEFLDGAGKEPTVLIYWASWCPHCRESAEKMVRAAECAKREGARLLLVNKLDGEKETRESAQAFLTDTKLEIENVFDEGAKLYEKKGLRMLPTVIVLDDTGRVTSYEEGEVPDTPRLASMVREARAGKTAFLAEAVKKSLMSDEGGVYTNYLPGDGSVPSGKDELSESMGFMLGYTAAVQDRALFDRLFGRLKDNRFTQDGAALYPWVVTDKQEINVNAAVDDFRIYRALRRAEEVWTDVQAAGREEALYEYMTEDGKLIDFYDVSSGQRAKTMTLCYADFEAMKLLAQRDGRWEDVSRNAMEIVEGGRISDDFPLYYSQFDYESGEYKKDAFNMAEELVTLLHLAEADCLPRDAFSWIVEELNRGAVYAGYGADGRPVLEKRYESTAVYALCALLAMEEGNLPAAVKALSFMEPLRIRDGGNPLDGLFGGEDGNGIYSFDQCAALAAYQRMDEIIAGQAGKMDEAAQNRGGVWRGGGHDYCAHAASRDRSGG